MWSFNIDKLPQKSSVESILQSLIYCAWASILSWLSEGICMNIGRGYTASSHFSACSKGRKSSWGTSWNNSSVFQGLESNKKFCLEHQVPPLNIQNCQEFKTLLCSISHSYFVLFWFFGILICNLFMFCIPCAYFYFRYLTLVEFWRLHYVPIYLTGHHESNAKQGSLKGILCGLSRKLFSPQDWRGVSSILVP